MERNAAIVWLCLFNLAACSDLLAIGDFDDGDRLPRDDEDMPAGGGGSTPETRTGDPLWVKVFAGNHADVAGALSIDDSDTLALAGTVTGAIAFGEVNVDKPGQQLFVVTLDEEGEVELVNASDGSASVIVSHMTASGGRIAVGGVIRAGTLELGALTAESTGPDQDGFVAIFGADDLTPLQLVAFGDSTAPRADQAVTAVAIAGDGVIVGGWFDDDLQIGTTMLDSVAARDAFVARVRSDGSVAWITPIAANGNEEVTALALRDDGSIWVAGTYDGSGPSPTSLDAKTGMSDVFVLLLDADGAFAGRANHFGGSGGRAIAHALALTADGVALTGGFTRTLSCGERLESGIDAEGIDQPQASSDIFVARLDDGLEPVWARRFGALGDDAGLSLAVDARGDLIIGGGFAGSTLFLPEERSESQGELDAFVVKLDGEAGETVWVHALGRNEPDRCIGTVVDADDRITVVGTFFDAFQLAGEAQLGKEREDIFAIRFAP